MVEGKKKKNERQENNQNRFLLVTIVILGLIFGFMLLGSMLIQSRNNDTFEQTATHIIATNNGVATLLEQTNIAGTEQFVMTSTALP